MGSSEYEVVNQFIRALGERDFETAAALLDPEVIFNEPAGLPYGGEWKGPAGIAALFEKILSEYTFEIRETELSDAGDRILVTAAVEFSSNQSGASMSQSIAEIYRVEDGKIVANQIFYHDVPGLAELHEVAAPAS
jgi:uncharacterized protein